MYEQHVLGVDKGVSLNMTSTCMTKKNYVERHDACILHVYDRDKPTLHLFHAVVSENVIHV